MERGRADVSYLDVRDRDGLVAGLRAEGHEGDLTAIPEIDYVLIQPDGDISSLAEAAKAGAPFDWAIASHVVEHVPDLIGWLDDVAELVTDDGVLVLAVPDRRYTFDLHRPPTTVGQMIEAHLDRDDRPTARAVYDHFSAAVSYNHLDLWRGVTSTYSDRIHPPEKAAEMVQRARDGEYVNCHVWLFTPESFLHQMHELRLQGHLQWYVEELVATPRDDIEFGVRMRRIPRFADPTGEQPHEVRSAADRPEWVEQQGNWQHDEALQHRITLLEGLVESMQERLTRQQAQIETRRARLRKLEERRAETNADYETALSDLRAEIKRLRTSLKAKDATMSEQAAELQRLRARPWQRLRRG